MSAKLTRFKWLVGRGFVAVFAKACRLALGVWVVGIAPAIAQVAVPVHESDLGQRLLTLEEGRSIVNVAWQVDRLETGMRDCSHLVHQIYANAGFEYPYASSFEIYAGTENFERVKNPHAGDLITWRGHVGIVVDPLQHSFYSLVRTGLEAQDYEAPYWRSRGRPRFYRYKVERDKVLRAANTAGVSRISNSHRQRSVDTVVGERTQPGFDPSNRPPAAASEKTDVIYGPPAPLVSPAMEKAEAETFEKPTSVLVATGNKPPTREEVEQGISELSDASGSVLRSDDPMKAQLPMVIVEQFRVERVDVKRDHGWARLVVDSRVMIGGGAAQVKRRHEKVRWELRRTESGWEAITPADRTYVPHDVAIKNLAATLAQLTNSDGAAEDQPAILREEAQLAGLLNTLLEGKQDR
jgi:hypothetical protein